MNIQKLGIDVTSRRSAGARVQISCLPTESQLHSLLLELPVGGEISVPDIGSCECFREARRVKDGFEIKRGCHGAYGTWRAASLDEAEAWLLPGLPVAQRSVGRGEGVCVDLPA